MKQIFFWRWESDFKYLTLVVFLIHSSMKSMSFSKNDQIRSIEI